MLKYKPITKSIIEKFHATKDLLTVVDPITNCRNWKGMTDKHGYGYLNDSPGDGKVFHYFVHRVSFAAQNPTIDISNKVIRHGCDNPSCWEPTHLLSGTQLDNIKDAIQRKRNCKGSASNFAKITEQQVYDIREEFAKGGTNYNRLSKKYGLSREHVRGIILRRRWGHLDGPY